MSEPLSYRRGVGLMLLDRRNYVFTGRRIDTPDAWQMPQGGIDEGETPRAAALRELEEEVGTAKAEFLAESRQWLRYELPAALHGKVWNGRYRGQEQKWFALRFLGSDSDINIATHEPEFDAWRWLPPADLLRGIVPFKRALYEAVLHEFAALLQS
ncbi:MAG TPA: RNA pyrophosphohydrolase [Stellaceae bacterium]|nr:RNA pyrophosphohydrolase [Stellaceae bacterium]